MPITEIERQILRDAYAAEDLISLKTRYKYASGLAARGLLKEFRFAMFSKVVSREAEVQKLLEV